MAAAETRKEASWLVWIASAAGVLGILLAVGASSVQHVQWFVNRGDDVSAALTLGVEIALFVLVFVGVWKLKAGAWFQAGLAGVVLAACLVWGGWTTYNVVHSARLQDAQEAARAAPAYQAAEKELATLQARLDALLAASAPAEYGPQRIEAWEAGQETRIAVAERRLTEAKAELAALEPDGVAATWEAWGRAGVNVVLHLFGLTALSLAGLAIAPKLGLFAALTAAFSPAAATPPTHDRPSLERPGAPAGGQPTGHTDAPKPKDALERSKAEEKALAMLLDNKGIRATARATGLHRTTVVRLRDTVLRAEAAEADVPLAAA